MENVKEVARREFLCGLKEEWRIMWQERYDDRNKAEAVAVRDYPSLLTDRGFVIFANKGAKIPSFSEIVEFWASQGLVYAPNPSVGGWGKFIRTELRKPGHLRAREYNYVKPKPKSEKLQLKKGGRGWVHRR